MGFWKQAGIKRDGKRSGYDGKVGKCREMAKAEWPEASELRFLSVHDQGFAVQFQDVTLLMLLSQMLGNICLLQMLHMTDILGEVNFKGHY